MLGALNTKMHKKILLRTKGVTEMLKWFMGVEEQHSIQLSGHGVKKNISFFNYIELECD